MNIEQLEDEFERIAEYAFNGVREGNWNGLKEWELLKDTFGEAGNDLDLEWSDKMFDIECTTFRERLITELEETKPDGSFNEANHYIIECVCIPYLNRFTIDCLMKVAFNVGCVHAMLHDYAPTHKNEFNDLRMGNFKSYVKF